VHLVGFIIRTYTRAYNLLRMAAEESNFGLYGSVNLWQNTAFR